MHPIMCVPHAGAGVSAFRAWQVKAGPSFTVIALPGRELSHGQPCLRSIADMAAHVAERLCLSGSAGVTLFGHSMGALVAYEATRRLRQERPGAVRRLVVSGCRSPLLPPPMRLSAIRDDATFLQAVAGLGGLPDDVTGQPAAVDYLLPILRADLGAADAYRHAAGEPLPVPLVAIGGDDDPFVPLSALSAWREVAGAGFEQVVMKGGHFFIFEQVDRVLRVLRS